MPSKVDLYCFIDGNKHWKKVYSVRLNDRREKFRSGHVFAESDADCIRTSWKLKLEKFLRLNTTAKVWDHPDVIEQKFNISQDFDFDLCSRKSHIFAVLILILVCII